MLIKEPVKMPDHHIHSSISVSIDKYVPTMKVITIVAIVQPRKSPVMLSRFCAAIFHAKTLAIKLADAPKLTSVIMLGIGLTTLPIKQPKVTPATAGHPKITDSGIKASAILTCASPKLRLDNNNTKTAYKAAKTTIKARSLLSNFNFFTSYTGVFMAERVEAHSPANKNLSQGVRIINVAMKKSQLSGANNSSLLSSTCSSVLSKRVNAKQQRYEEKGLARPMEVTSLAENILSTSVTWITDFVETNKWNKTTVVVACIAGSKL